MYVRRAHVQPWRLSLQVRPFAVGLIGALARPNLVLDVNEESASARNLHIDDRFITGHFPPDPILAVGVGDWEAELAEEQPKAKAPLSVCAELAHVVIQHPSQHHTVPNLLAGQPHDVEQVEVFGDLFLLMAVMIYGFAVPVEQSTDATAIIRRLCLP